MKNFSLKFIFVFAGLLLGLASNRASAQYCTPEYFQGCTLGGALEDFSLTGVSSSISDLATGCTSTMGTGFPPAYIAYLDHSTMSVTLNPASTYTVVAKATIVLSGAPNGQIFIDFNDNFNFTDPGESVGGGVFNVLTSTNFPITIPAGVSAGTHRMRIVVSGSETYPAVAPCPTALVALNGETHDYSVYITGTSTTCAPVTGLGISAITSSTATVSWTAVTGAIGYEWAVTTSATPPASGTLTTATSVPATGLTASTTYYAHVRTKCGATSFSTWVTTASFTTTAAPTTCAAVTGVTISAITAGTADASWAAVTGAIGYEWAVTTSATPPASGTLTTATSVTATGLTASTTYYAHVRTKCSATLFSSWTTSTSFTTTAAPTTCDPVTAVTMSSITSGSSILNWAAVTGAIGYEWAVTTSATAPASGTATLLTTSTATGLTAGTAYYAHVRVKCSSTLFSSWVSTPFTTAAASTCPAITGLAVSAITGTGATVSWTAVTSGSVGYQYVIDNIVTDPIGSGTNTTATTTSPTGLTAGTTYYAHVRDSCGVGNFSPWSTIPFTTLSSICNAVTGLTASAITANTATLNWTMASGAVASQYVVDNTAADPMISGTTTTTSTAALAGLTGSTTYYAHVRDSCGVAALSAWVTIPLTTLAAAGIENINNGAGFGISAYPNPVRGDLTIQISGNSSNNGQLVVTDIAGKVITTAAVTGTSVTLDLNHVPAGLYLVRYTDSVNTRTLKVSKQ